ncbi:MAG: glycosyltransferase family 2 protein [Candidatus Omnitrophica bacterium]|nr:glycosyltransferase family 2 protein [Candidatus Omnitrophota bacterium]
MHEEKVIVVMPAYNAGLTLEKTYKDIPKDIVGEIILCDDSSTDNTVEIARRLGLKVIVHDKNKGYGANQKTCYRDALRKAADIVIMLHPDYQYDAKEIPGLIRPIREGTADVVLGSRILNKGALKGGMPLYKYISNRLSTIYENKVLGLNLSEYHTGLRAYSRRFLETVNWKDYSDDFLFDGEILIDAVRHGFKIKEVPIETRYFKEASQISPIRGIKYGIGIFYELQKYKRGIHRGKIKAKGLFS